jgi:hypothetical protein
MVPVTQYSVMLVSTSSLLKRRSTSPSQSLQAGISPRSRRPARPVSRPGWRRGSAGGWPAGGRSRPRCSATAPAWPGTPSPRPKRVGRRAGTRPPRAGGCRPPRPGDRRQGDANRRPDIVALGAEPPVAERLGHQSDPPSCARWPRPAPTRPRRRRSRAAPARRRLDGPPGAGGARTGRPDLDRGRRGAVHRNRHADHSAAEHRRRAARRPARRGHGRSSRPGGSSA